MPNADCLFCQIISGQVPAYKIYEDDNVLAILDINPVNPGHTLILPKKHSANMLDAEEIDLQAMSVTAQKVARAVITALGLDAFNLESNNGRLAGQVIPHLHWHIIPRSAEDGLQPWPGKEYQAGQAEELVIKIKAQL